MSDWHSRFGGRAWRVIPQGIETRDHAGVHRTAGAPITMRRYLQYWGPAIRAAAKAEGVPPVLLLMTLATENGLPRLGNGRIVYTPVRKEPGYVSDEDTPNRISVGPCHVLISSARAAMGDPSIDRARLLDPAFNIRVAARFIANQESLTGYDPILVAAAYNAGSLYPARPDSRYHNPWHLRSYGDHLDRAAAWYGDAVAVLREQAMVTAPAPHIEVVPLGAGIERLPTRPPHLEPVIVPDPPLRDWVKPEARGGLRHFLPRLRLPNFSWRTPMQIIRAFLSRIVGAGVAMLVAWLATVGLELGPDFAASATETVVLFLFAAMQLVYAVVHRMIDRRINPQDTAR